MRHLRILKTAWCGMILMLAMASTGFANYPPFEDDTTESQLSVHTDSTADPRNAGAVNFNSDEYLDIIMTFN